MLLSQGSVPTVGSCGVSIYAFYSPAGNKEPTAEEFAAFSDLGYILNLGRDVRTLEGILPRLFWFRGSRLTSLSGLGRTSTALITDRLWCRRWRHQLPVVLRVWRCKEAESLVVAAQAVAAAARASVAANGAFSAVSTDNVSIGYVELKGLWLMALHTSSNSWRAKTWPSITQRKRRTLDVPHRCPRKRSARRNNLPRFTHSSQQHVASFTTLSRSANLRQPRVRAMDLEVIQVCDSNTAESSYVRHTFRTLQKQQVYPNRSIFGNDHGLDGSSRAEWSWHRQSRRPRRPRLPELPR